MNKRYLAVFICIIFSATSGFSQTRTMKDLVGKWQRTNNIVHKDSVEYIFVNDSLFIFKDKKGFFRDIYRCRFDLHQDPIEFTRYGINRDGNTIEIKYLLKFVNDNTIALQTKEQKDPKKAITVLLTKIDSKDYSYITKPTLLHLKGWWMYSMDKFVNFISDSLATIKDGGNFAVLYSYKVDFTKYPYYIDLKSQEDNKTVQGLFTLPTDSTMIFATFPHNDRKGYFNTFYRYTYLKLDSVKRAIMIKRIRSR